MEINFYGTTELNNSQVGDNNTMNIGSIQGSLSEQNWKELQQLLENCLRQETLALEYRAQCQELLAYVKIKDEQRIKDSMRKTAKEFFVNVLSNIASSGLLLALNKLCV